MVYVSILIELLRSQPRLLFWFATLSQAAVWWLLSSIFYTAPPGDLAEILAIGHQYQLGSYLGPPLAFWVADAAYTVLGAPGVYLMSQICMVVTYWAVLRLGTALVGIHHAVIAVVLMIGISSFTVPTPEFGPQVMAMPLTALVILHVWRAVGAGQRRYWFVLAIEIGLLLLTSYAGVVLVLVLMAFIAATARGRASMQHVEPWFAAIVVAILLFPHLIWLDVAGGAALLPGLERLHDAGANLLAGGRLVASVVLTHAGLVVLVVLAAGWWTSRKDEAPAFARPPIDPFARKFVYVLAIAPIIVASLIAALIGELSPVGGIGSQVVLSGLAVTVAAGAVILVHHQRIVGYAWFLLLLLPPAITVAAMFVLPWTTATELKVAQPAREIGRYFADNFERRTGRPLAIVTGDPRLAAMVAAAAPTRPSLYAFATPARTPWVSTDDIKRKGIVVVWTASDTQAGPPPDILARFPGLVAEVPRAFEHRIQGRLPLLRLGWGMIRPANSQ